MQDIFEIDIGQLNNLTDLQLHLSKRLSELRTNYINGRHLIPLWDLRNLQKKSIRISALAAFLSISKKLRDFIGAPIPIILKDDPEITEILKGLNFFEVATRLDLFHFQKAYNSSNSRTIKYSKGRIFYYTDIPDINNLTIQEIRNWKDVKREEFKRSLKLKLANIFSADDFSYKWSTRLEGTFIVTGAELIVNALLHGQDYAFVAVQKSKTGISFSVCDSGQGFKKSMISNYSWVRDNPLFNHASALMTASLAHKNIIGLYRAIDDVIGRNGSVTLTSFDAELVWKYQYWQEAKAIFNGYSNRPIIAEEFDQPVSGSVDDEKYDSGYYKIFPDFLVGSRVAFELFF